MPTDDDAAELARLLDDAIFTAALFGEWGDSSPVGERCRAVLDHIAAHYVRREQARENVEAEMAADERWAIFTGRAGA